MQKKYKILIFTIIIGVLIMSAIIIPSKHIYGEPTYNTSNNIINSIYADENTCTINDIEVYNQTNITSSNIYKNTYIGEWSVSGSIRLRWELECVYHEFEVEVDTTNSIIYDSLTTTISITTQGNTDIVGNFSNKAIVLKRGNVDYSITNIPLVNEGVLSIAKFCNNKILEKNAYELTIETPYSFKCKVKFLKSIKTYMGQELLMGDLSWGDYSRKEAAYNPNITNIDIKINANYNSVESNAYKYGSGNGNLKLETNELLQIDTLKYIIPVNELKDKYNEISYHNEYDISIKRYVYVTSAYAVRSDVQVKVSYYIGGQSAKTVTLTIPNGFSTSQKIEVDVLAVFGNIVQIITKKDDYYAYDYNYYLYNDKASKIGKYISEDIISNYKNGKKRINIQVGYGDYYYEDGSPYGGVAGAKKLLQVGDVVQPMQWKNEKDVPFAINKDGTPMIFEITSAELDTSGAPKLFLQLLQKTT